MKQHSRKSKSIIVIAIIVIIAGIAGTRFWQRHQEASRTPIAIFPAERGPLSITVQEGGTIHPREQVILSSQLEGRNRILELIPEGTLVEEGDLLVELDASGLVDRRVDLEISVQNAESAYIRSRENLEVVRNQAESDNENAELEYQFAKEDLSQYREGEHPNRVMELEARITIEREELERAREKLQWSNVLFEEQYLAESEVQADALAVRRAELDVEMAENNLRFLENFEYRRKITQLESDKNQARMALERTKRRARADVIQAEADLRAKESEFKQNEDRLKRLNEQIENARITAPREGLVIYATSTRFRWRGNVEPLAEGQEVNQRQELIHLPTAAGFMARIRVHESSLQKVEVGQSVTITTSALPGHTFEGKVSTIAPLPDPASTFMNPDLKLYDTEILIEGGTDVLRTGMSCQTIIHIDELEDAVHVPVHTVVRHRGRPTVFIHTSEGPEPREVEVGDDDGRMVHIISGLEEGEPVMLAPPVGPQHESRRTRSEDGREEMEAPPETPEVPQQPPTERPQQQQQRRQGPPA